MQYKSPIPLLQYAGVDLRKFVAADLSRAQKRLLVELDLSQKTSLEINGQSITKDDILTVISELQDGKTLLYHQWIYDSSYLVKLLHYKEPSSYDRSFNLSYTYHAEFHEFQLFISPYLAQPFSKTLNQAILKRDFFKAQELLVTRYLIHDSYFDAAFSKPRNSLAAIASEIKTAKQDAAQFNPANFQYIGLYFIEFLNLLPEPLHPVREAIVSNLISLSVAIQTTHLEFCDLLYTFLKDVETDEATKKIIKSNAAVFANNLDKRRAAEPDDGISFFGWVKILAVIFFAIVAIRACTNSGARSKPKVFDAYWDAGRFSPKGLEMLLLRNELHVVTSGQLDSSKYDSMRKVWVMRPQKISMNAWPYSEIAKDLETYRPQMRQYVDFINSSEYDVILMLHNRDQLYTAHLPAGDTLSSGIAPNDILSVYIGKGWDTKKWFRHKSLTNGVELRLNGLYTSIDSTTLDYCKEAWTFNCQTDCQGLKIAFTSPVPKSFRMEQENNYFTTGPSYSGARQEDFQKPVPSSDTGSLKIK